jgi:hypothetical protein
MRSGKADRDFQSAMATALPRLPEIRLHQDFDCHFLLNGRDMLS